VEEDEEANEAPSSQPYSFVILYLDEIMCVAFRIISLDFYHFLACILLIC
jgi:hypothetical protein